MKEKRIGDKCTNRQNTHTNGLLVDRNSPLVLNEKENKEAQLQRIDTVGVAATKQSTFKCVSCRMKQPSDGTGKRKRI